MPWCWKSPFQTMQGVTIDAYSFCSEFWRESACYLCVSESCRDSPSLEKVLLTGSSASHFALEGRGKFIHRSHYWIPGVRGPKIETGGEEFRIPGFYSWLRLGLHLPQFPPPPPYNKSSSSLLTISDTCCQHGGHFSLQG